MGMSAIITLRKNHNFFPSHHKMILVLKCLQSISEIRVSGRGQLMTCMCFSTPNTSLRQTIHDLCICVVTHLPKWCQSLLVAMVVVMATSAHVLAETVVMLMRKLKGLMLILGSNYFLCGLVEQLQSYEGWTWLLYQLENKMLSLKQTNLSSKQNSKSSK